MSSAQSKDSPVGKEPRQKRSLKRQNPRPEPSDQTLRFSAQNERLAASSGAGDEADSVTTDGLFDNPHRKPSAPAGVANEQQRAGAFAGR